MPERWTSGRPIGPRPLLASKRGEHGLREQLDVLRGEGAGQAAELKQPHEHAGALRGAVDPEGRVKQVQQTGVVAVAARLSCYPCRRTVPVRGLTRGWRPARDQLVATGGGGRRPLDRENLDGSNQMGTMSQVLYKYLERQHAEALVRDGVAAAPRSPSIPAWSA